MTDADLIAALGWKPCRSFRGSGPCDEHGYAQRLNPSGVCSYQAARLHLVRAGIDLARTGIADSIGSNVRLATFDRDGFAQELATEIAMEWQP